MRAMIVGSAAQSDFKIALKQARRYLTKSDDTHHTLGQPIFGDENFAEVVGHYLASQKKTGRELLANHLNASDYTFTKEEYERLVKEEPQATKFIKPLVSAHEFLNGKVRFCI